MGIAIKEKKSILSKGKTSTRSQKNTQKQKRMENSHFGLAIL